MTSVISSFGLIHASKSCAMINGCFLVKVTVSNSRIISNVLSFQVTNPFVQAEYNNIY